MALLMLGRTSGLGGRSSQNSLQEQNHQDVSTGRGMGVPRGPGSQDGGSRRRQQAAELSLKAGGIISYKEKDWPLVLWSCSGVERGSPT